MNAQDLLQKAQAGKLSSDQLTQLARTLHRARPGDDRYTLLHALALARAKQYRELVERFIDSPEEPELARLALTTLCTTWGETQSYQPQVLAFLRGVDWDVAQGGRVLLACTAIAGEYLRSGRQPDFLAELLDIYSKEDALFQHACYVALGRAMSYPWHKILMRQIPEAKLIADARTRLNQERA